MDRMDTGRPAGVVVVCAGSGELLVWRNREDRVSSVRWGSSLGERRDAAETERGDRGGPMELAWAVRCLQAGASLVTRG